LSLKLQSAKSQNKFNFDCLHTIIEDKTQLSNFKSFCKRERFAIFLHFKLQSCIENLLFIEEVAKFRKLKLKKKLRAEAENIYKKFIIEDSKLSLGISQRLHLDVKKIIFEENHLMTTKLFDPMVIEVEWSMKDHLKKFQLKINSSKSFKDHLKNFQKKLSNKSFRDFSEDEVIYAQEFNSGDVNCFC
jgi:hypothetical protein